MRLNQNTNFLIITQNFTKNQAAEAIATSNALLALSQRLNRPILHFWTLSDTIILGHMDAKLKSLPQGLKFLADHHYQTIIRNAGGLGVVSDDGVINLGFYFPKQGDLTINAAYTEIADFMKEIFQPLNLKVETGEIVNSYCPGTFDLSVNGQKIAGLAQRRAKNNVSVMLYLSLTGDQLARGQLMHDFYQIANQPVHPKLKFPDVDPQSMTTISKLLEHDFTLTEFIKLIKTQLTAWQISFQEVNLSEIADQQFQTDLTANLTTITARMEEL